MRNICVLEYYIIHWAAEQHFNQFTHFRTAHPCAQHTETYAQRETDTQITLCATSAAIVHILCIARKRCTLKIAVSFWQKQIQQKTANSENVGRFCKKFHDRGYVPLYL